MEEWINITGRGRQGSRHLTYEEAVQAAHMVARGESTDAQTAAFLIAMRMKGESFEEVKGFIDVFRKYSLPYKPFPHSLNCAGPYDGRLYFPVTLPVSLLLASAGFPQVLHGSESLPPKLGVSLKELLEGLGVQVELQAKEWEDLFRSLGIGFIWTELICPPLGRVRPVRKQLALRTFLNRIEKILNPVQSQYMLIGVNHEAAMDQLTHLLPQLGIETAYAIQGIEGSEDLPTYKTTLVRRVNPWGDTTSMIDPAVFGFSGKPLEPCSKEKQLQLLNRILQGEEGPDLHNEKEHIVFNAGLRLYWFEKVESYEEGFQLARTLLERGDPYKLLAKWRDLSSRSGMFLAEAGGVGSFR
ncbi:MULTISPECIES: anthranilate phosphoribosyltransferase [Paenibacillus]|uniref:anthranilate phosphoribosyltransferase n=1 Tax=Paenibacillus TaxID=44249 RepID=UPI0022B8FD90|nr:anthranilate phosphoribosyltransferase [Paenibacillus caseinilyticus]MCZ8521408.1 anthranilate phosphoribosyltransferase [Paenibacillus caseinilyticus]